MANGSGAFRGDRNRNARLGRLRELVRLENTIVGIDLAEKKQMVVCDHDSRVLARRTFRCRVWDLGLALDWAAERAAVKGFVGVTVSSSRPDSVRCELRTRHDQALDPYGNALADPWRPDRLEPASTPGAPPRRSKAPYAAMNRTDAPLDPGAPHDRTIDRLAVRHDHVRRGIAGRAAGQRAAVPPREASACRGVR
jgi:hypothetical protein